MSNNKFHFPTLFIKSEIHNIQLDQHDLQIFLHIIVMPPVLHVQNSLSDGFSGDGVKPSWALPVSNLACATTALAVMVLIGELVVLLVPRVCQCVCHRGVRYVSSAHVMFVRVLLALLADSDCASVCPLFRGFEASSRRCGDLL